MCVLYTCSGWGGLEVTNRETLGSQDERVKFKVDSWVSR